MGAAKTKWDNRRDAVRWRGAPHMPASNAVRMVNFSALFQSFPDDLLAGVVGEDSVDVSADLWSRVSGEAKTHLEKNHSIKDNSYVEAVLRHRNELRSIWREQHV